MATYTIHINERSSEGKAFAAYLIAKGAIITKKVTTDSPAVEIAKKVSGVRSGKIKTRSVMNLLHEL